MLNGRACTRALPHPSWLCARDSVPSAAGRPVSDRLTPARAIGGAEIEFVSLVALVGWATFFGLAASIAAGRLDRPRPLWLALGAVLGPLALIVLRIAPPGQCRSCGSPTRGWLNTCWWCGNDVRGRRPAAATAGSPGAEPSAGASLSRERTRSTEPLREPRLDRRDAPTAPPAASPRDAVGNDQLAGARPASITAMPWSRPDASRDVGDSPGQWRSPVGQPGIASGGLAPSHGHAAGSLAPTHGEAPLGLATAVYVTGNTDLKPGFRYGIAIQDAWFRVLGPIETDPSTIALERPIAGMIARSVDGRLILGNAQGLVLAFMAVAGPGTQDVATAIAEAARTAAAP